jgi:CHAT domain-containing protein
MGGILSEQTWNDEQLAEQLMALSRSEEFNRMLRYRREPINSSVVRRLKDEVARLIRADIHRAVRLAEVTRAAAALCDDPVGLALAHHACAMAMDFSGQYDEAVELYRQAEAIYAQLGRAVEAARVARARISPLLCLGRYEEALRVAAKAREVFQRHGETSLLAQVEVNVGCIYHRLDQYREALTFFQRAEETFARQQDEFGLAHARFNAANQYTQLNEFEKALTLYQQAQEGYERLNMPQMVNQTEYSIAWLYFLRGRLQDSLKLFVKARLRAGELGDRPLEALCDLDLAEIYLQLNTYEDALEAARLAAEKFEQLKMNYEYAKAKMYLGIVHTHLSDFAAAEQQLQQARRVFLAEGNEVYTALSNIYLSDVLTYRQEWDQALQLCAEAKRLFGQQSLSAKAAYAEVQRARLRLFMGDGEGAERFGRSAWQLIGEAEAPWLRYQCLHLLGNSMQQLGHEQEAYEHYTKAIEYLETMRSSIRLDEFKCTFVKDKLRVYQDLVELCLRVGTEEKIEEAFAYAEAAKSRSLVELLATDRSIGGKSDQPSVQQLHGEWKRLREELDYYYNRINHHESQGQQRPARLSAELQQEVREREQQLTRLTRLLRLEDVEFSSLHTMPRLDTRQVRQCLAADEVLIEYYLVNERIAVFVISSEGIRAVNDVSEVGTVVPLLRKLRFYFDKFTLNGEYINTYQDNIQTVTDQCLRLLYAELVEPIAPLLDGKKVVIVPHGVLHYVPFHALYDGRQYLSDRQEISYSPSAGVFTLCSEKAQKQPVNGDVLVMAVPDEGMPFIQDEVAAVRSLWPNARVFLGAEATFERLDQCARTCRLLHLASHAIFRRDNPMFSALKLGDSWLSFYDIFNLRLNAELVTLSACETGMNEVFPGDELFGLMRGFLYAGAPSLIVSLWRVNDRSTAEFMRWLYTGLSEGLSKRAALRLAQLKVKQEYRHPYYWAPFILVGSPS